MTKTFSLRRDRYPCSSNGMKSRYNINLQLGFESRFKVSNRNLTHTHIDTRTRGPVGNERKSRMIFMLSSLNVGGYASDFRLLQLPSADSLPVSGLFPGALKLGTNVVETVQSRKDTPDSLTNRVFQKIHPKVSIASFLLH